MAIEKFEDIKAWQKSRQLIVLVYKQFAKSKDYSFRDQIQRAAVSVASNIAEGYERRGDKELKHYFFMAKGSCGEVRSLLYAALDLQYINESDFKNLSDLASEISRMLSGFIKKLD